jgi:site-specific recombinase XerC
MLVEACADCHAWGVTRTTGWLCKGCSGWRAAHPRIAGCRSCGRQRHVDDDQACRLCRKQRSFILATGDRGVDLVTANRHGQQLFLADMFHRRHRAGRDTAVEHTVRPTVAAPIRSTPPPVTPVGHRQLVLLELPRDLPAGLRYGFPPPPDPRMHAALAAMTAAHAVGHGWSRSVTETVQRAMRVLLGTQDTPGAPIMASTVLELTAIELPVRPVLDVLAVAGMLEDDRVPAVLRWAATQIATLPAPMRHELEVWMQVMREGNPTTPRIAPRSDRTLHSQLGFALPTLRRWARVHTSLREIGRDDVLAALPAAGTARSTTLQGLRSIFRVLKARKLVFVNPTVRIGAPHPHRAIPGPIELDRLRNLLIIDPANPTRAALAALLAFHAVRVHQIIALQLTDARDGRLHLPDRIVPLAGPVRERLRAYLDHRQRCWPGTANPHLFIHYRNATTTTASTPWWIRRQLGMSAQAIRQDRILQEAHATGGDVRMLCELFGLSVAGATHYAAGVDGQDAAAADDGSLS